LTVAILGQRSSQFFQLLGTDETLAIGDLLRAGNLETLTVFNGFDEVASFYQTLVGARIQPA